MTGNKKCETDKCVACNCQCNESGSHSCHDCNICTQNDDHTRKSS